jgi:hypothetical protein
MRRHTCQRALLRLLGVSQKDHEQGRAVHKEHDHAKERDGLRRRGGGENGREIPARGGGWLAEPREQRRAGPRRGSARALRPSELPRAAQARHNPEDARKSRMPYARAPQPSARRARRPA